MPLLYALAGIALLGNGIKAIVSSSVLVSEAQFAAFLQIPVEHVAVLLQAIIAGMVIALALCPLLLQRFQAQTVAIAACVVATAAFATFAFVDMAQPAPWLRDFAVFACFAIGSAALACLAPTALALLLLWPGSSGRATLTTLWTGAAAAGFLVAPQLAKYLLPAFGLAGYFLAFSALPLLMLALLLWLTLAAPAAPTATNAGPRLPAPLLLTFVAVIVAFEIWSTLGSVTGYLAPAALAGLLALLITSSDFLRRLRRLATPTASPGATYWLLAALFVLEVPTTGFFEAAFLFVHVGDEALVADRSTLAASAQIAGTFAAGLLMHRRPAALRTLLLGFAAIAFFGVASYVAYPWVHAHDYFLWTPMVAGFGSSGVTVLVCLAVLPAGRRMPILATLPPLVIMLGTEFGLELLQLVFAGVTALGSASADAYRVLFATQAIVALAVLVLLLLTRRRELPGVDSAMAADRRAGIATR